MNYPEGGRRYVSVYSSEIDDGARYAAALDRVLKSITSLQETITTLLTSEPSAGGATQESHHEKVTKDNDS